MVSRIFSQEVRKNAAENAVPYMFLAPTLILLLAFLAIPFFSLFWNSVHWTDLAGVSTFNGLANFRVLLREDRFLQNILNTVRYMLGVLVISVPLAYFAAILVNSNAKGVGALRTIFLIPWVIAPVVTALLFKTMLDPRMGPITRLLSWIFNEPVYLALTMNGARMITIVHSAWRSFPIEMLLISAGMTSISPELYEASRVDGASGWDMFWHITLPLTRGPLLSAVLLVSVSCIQESEGVYALTLGGPGYATEVTGVRLFKEAFLYFHISIASALGVALICVAIIWMTLYSRVLGKDEGI